MYSSQKIIHPFLFFFHFPPFFRTCAIKHLPKIVPLSAVLLDTIQRGLESTVFVEL